MSPGAAAWRLIACGILVLAGLTVADDAFALRRFVPADHRTIQEAIEAAAPGDTLWVAAGRYPGGLVMKKQLVLFADAGPDSTILDGGEATRVLHIEGVRGASIIGFDIRRGKAPSGGGIYCLRDTVITIAGCVFRDNWESAIGAWQTMGIYVTESQFWDNRGSAISLDHSIGIFRSVHFERNSGHGGGAISLVHSETTLGIRECVFRANRAEGSTGGAVNASDSSDVSLTNCTFEENTSKVAGGAAASMSGSRVNVASCRFRANRAATGGALHSDYAGLNVAYSIFNRNRSTAAGAAIGIIGEWFPNVNGSIHQNTFYKNGADSEGSAIFITDASPEILKNIFVVEADQRAVSGVKTSPRYECNLIHDPAGGGIGALPSADTLVGDPLFCEPEEGDFHLRDLSPALLAACGLVGAQGRGCSTFHLVPSR